LFSDQILIDTHVHLNEIEHVNQVVQNATAVGVGKLVAVGMDRNSCHKTLKLAEQFPGIVYPAIGYHPWSIKDDEIEETMSYIEEHLDLCVALGEIGLDYRVKVKKSLQREVFSRTLRLAEERKKPVIVHSRYSHERTYQMVSATEIEKAVFHWYSGPLKILDRIIKDGYYVSATPALAYSPPHRAAIDNTPLEQILIETDAPVEYQGRISEPSNLIDTLQLLSHLKDLPLDDMAGITTQNAKHFFGI